MLASWLFAFTLGAVLARCPFAASWWRPAFPEWAWFVLLILALSLARWSWRWPRHVAVVVAFVGFFWGIAHAAPPPTRPWSKAQVLAVTTRFAARGPLLVKTTGGTFAADGRQSDATDVWVWPATVVRPAWFGSAQGRAHVRGAVKTPAVVLEARRVINRRLSELPSRERGFLAAILLGEKAGLHREWHQAFFVTGLLHLLVVSGLHVSLVAQALTFLIAWPSRLLYAARRLSPTQWRQLQAGLRLAAATGAVGYAALVGMNAASHRSAFAYALLQVTSVFCGSAVLAKRLMLVFALQTLVFPVGLFSDATGMSWFAYLVVLEVARLDRPFWRRCTDGLLMQTKLIGGAGAFFANLPLLGLVANPVFVPLFPLLLACGVGATAGIGVAINLACVRTYADWVLLLAGLATHVPLNPDLSAAGLGICRAWTAVVWLNTCRRLSIRQYEDS